MSGLGWICFIASCFSSAGGTSIICIGSFVVVCFGWLVISRCPCSFFFFDFFFASVWRCSAIAGAVSSADCFCFVCCSPCLVVFGCFLFVFVWVLLVFPAPLLFLVLLVGFSRCGTSIRLASGLFLLCSSVVAFFSDGGVIISCTC